MMTRVSFSALMGFLAVLGDCRADSGGVDGAFAPELRRRVVPSSVIVGGDGRILLGSSWSGYDRVDGVSVGDRLFLDGGGVYGGEAVAGLLEPTWGYPVIGEWWAGGVRDWFALEGGEWLVPVAGSGWLKRGEAGELVPMFVDLEEGERVIPQFLREGKLWVIRAGGQGGRKVEVRRVSDGAIDESFEMEATWPEEPLQCVPAADGGAWVLGGEALPLLLWMSPSFVGETSVNRVFRVDASGAWVSAVAVRELDRFRSPQLRAADSGYRVLLGRDRRMDLMWPRPSRVIHQIGWFDDQGEEVRWVSIAASALVPFWWEDAGGERVLATGEDGWLRRYLPDGEVDMSFESPGRVSSLVKLPGGKWLVDGTRRLLADGQVDPLWEDAELSAPAQVRVMESLADGRVLVAGKISSAGGTESGDLVILHADGTVDDRFRVDGRVESPQSVAISGEKIYVVLEQAMRLASGRMSNLVALDMDGAVDEAFDPFRDPLLQVERYVEVLAQPDGGVMARGERRMEVISSRWYRLGPTGEVEAVFPWRDGELGPRVVALSGGGLVMGHTFYGSDGGLLREVGSGVDLQPIAEWQGGVLFDEAIVGRPRWRRLRLWKEGRWEPGFAAEPIRENPGVVLAEEGADASLHLFASWEEGEQGLKRLLADGTVDESFEAAAFTLSPRREAGAWKLAGAGGLESFDPESMQIPVSPRAILYHPGNQTLWVGGEFQKVGGLNRDGLARLEAGEVPVSGGEERSAYDSWALGMGLGAEGPEGDADQDGVLNLLEFFFGTSPWARSEGVDLRREGGELVFGFPRSLEAMDLAVAVEISEDLERWEVVEPALIDEVGLSGDRIRREVRVPEGDEVRRFFRIRVEMP